MVNPQEFGWGWKCGKCESVRSLKESAKLCCGGSDEPELFARIEFPVKSEEEFEKLRDASELPNERWELVRK